MPRRKPDRTKNATEAEPAVRLLAVDEHPDYVAGSVTDENVDPAGFTPVPGGPLPPIPPQPFPLPVPLPQPFPGPQPFPFPQPMPGPWPLRICGPVSGRYVYSFRPVLEPLPVRPAILPHFLTVTVRVDVDRFFPQDRISIEVNRLFPRSTSHAIAEVTSDACVGFNRRRIAASITYRDGDPALIPGDQVLFEASRGRGLGYGTYTLTLSGGGLAPRTYALRFQSPYFDAVEFEVDRVENAGDVVTTVDTGAHPNRPGDLPNEVISLTSVFQRAGFDVAVSPNETTIPLADAGANGTWSDAEMHDAMVAYWSRFGDRPQWAMWVLYAARHDMGRGLGGIMFDDIGPQHRQGTAIFTDSFIQDAPAGDGNAAAWRRRSVFWTAVHEMGHAFNLAHAWQKALGVPQGAPGDPWIPLANEPEARSFMNYPDRVAGGQASFYGDFRFRFTDDELVFMRHAPRRFVQMGNSNWFANHGFEAPSSLLRSGRWTLKLRPNRELNAYAYMEPVTIELKLTNDAGHAVMVDAHLLEDGRHVTIFLQHEGGDLRRWRPMITRCHEEHADALDPGESAYGAHTISASPDGWLIDEPGFYKVQAAVDMGDEIVVSNVLRLHVAPPTTADERELAPAYFTEDVARALAFGGAPSLMAAMDTLREVVARIPENPAAVHAALALSTPMLRDFKRLELGAEPEDMVIRSDAADVASALAIQTDALLDAPDRAAATLGHIEYFEAVDDLVDAMATAGDGSGAKEVLQQSVKTMERRGVLASVIAAAERKVERLT